MVPFFCERNAKFSGMVGKFLQPVCQYLLHHENTILKTCSALTPHYRNEHECVSYYFFRGYWSVVDMSMWVVAFSDFTKTKIIKDFLSTVMCFVLRHSQYCRSSCRSSSVLGYIVNSMGVCMSAAGFIIIFKCSHSTSDWFCHVYFGMCHWW